MIQSFLNRRRKSKGTYHGARQEQALIAQQQEAEATKQTTKEVVTNAPITSTVVSPNQVGNGKVRIASSLPEAENIYLSIDSDAATATQTVFILGNENVYRRLFDPTYTGRNGVTVTSGSGSDVYDIVNELFCSNTYQFHRITLEAFQTASATNDANAKAQLRKNWRRLEANTSGTSGKFHDMVMRLARNPFQEDSLYADYEPEIEQGMINPLTAIVIPEFLTGVRLEVTLAVTARKVGL